MSSRLSFTHSSSENDYSSDSDPQQNLYEEEKEENTNSEKGEDSILETSDASHDINFKSDSTNEDGLSLKLSENKESNNKSSKGKEKAFKINSFER